MAEDKIKNVIETIKPILGSEGGSIEFVKYEDNIVYIRMGGACSMCGYLGNTIEGIELAIKSEVPEVEKVELTI